MTWQGEPGDLDPSTCPHSVYLAGHNLAAPIAFTLLSCVVIFEVD